MGAEDTFCGDLRDAADDQRVSEKIRFGRGRRCHRRYDVYGMATAALVFGAVRCFDLKFTRILAIRKCQVLSGTLTVVLSS